MFTTPCFINKNTPELRKKLEEIGYKNYIFSINEDSYDLITTSDDGFYYLFLNKTFENVDHCLDIDCGDNEELFIALAALRDDTDKDQLFTNGVKWIWSRFSKGFYCNGWHKATAEELIKHFNK